MDSVVTPFEIYLRTGRRSLQAAEFKFNPWHDPKNGRFTFAGHGQNYPAGQHSRRVSAHLARTSQPNQDREFSDGSDRRGEAPDRSYLNPKHPRNWTVYVVQRGDTLSHIAQKRRGLTARDLAWVNDIPVDKPLQISQRIKLPTQRSLDDGREARSRFMALALYMGTHDGQMPPNPAKPPSVAEQVSATYRQISANGYLYALDLVDRFERVTGVLTRNKEQGRSRKAQEMAGGADRLPTDHGGHIIARRFNGPKDWFNHFAQDGSFNRGAYAKLEKKWDREMDAGHTVRIDIRASYEGLSLRPNLITVYYWVDEQPYVRRFANAPREKR